MIKKKFWIILLIFILILIAFIFRLDYHLFVKANNNDIIDNINPENCIQLYPSDGKIKILFIPEYSYSSGNSFSGFKKDIETILDLDQKNYGLFSIDIIDDNKDKFSFYYLNKIPKNMRCRNGYSDGGLSKIFPRLRYKDQTLCSFAIKEAMTVCGIKNIVVLNKIVLQGYAGAFENQSSLLFVSTNFKEKIIVPNYYFVDRTIFSLPLKMYKNEEEAKIINSIVFTHEFSHAIFHLSDLYTGINIIKNNTNFLESNTLMGCDLEGCSKWCEDFDKNLTNYIISNFDKTNLDYEDINTGINCSNGSGCYSGCYGGFRGLWRPFKNGNVGDKCDIMFDSQNCYLNKNEKKIKIGYNFYQESIVRDFFNNI
jgi:hypothetical protein